MDRQTSAAKIQRDPETEYGAWPKKRTLVIGARTTADFIRAGQLVKRFEEDVRKYKQRSGRHHGIIYTTRDRDDPQADYENPAYVWYTTNQVTIHFGEQPHG